MKLDLENYRCSCKLLGLIILGEGYIDVKLISHIMSDNLILKSGYKLSAAKLKGKLLSLSAVKRHSILEALKVDYYIVAVLASSVVNVNCS